MSDLTFFTLIGTLLTGLAASIFTFYKKICLLILPTIFICFVTIGYLIGYHNHRLWYERFNAQKQIIEESVISTYLTGLERIELVKLASTLNGEFAEKVYNANQWYGLIYDPRILTTEPITLK